MTIKFYKHNQIIFAVDEYNRLRFMGRMRIKNPTMTTHKIPMYKLRHGLESLPTIYSFPDIHVEPNPHIYGEALAKCVAIMKKINCFLNVDSELFSWRRLEDIMLDAHFKALEPKHKGLLIQAIYPTFRKKRYVSPALRRQPNSMPKLH